VVPNHVIQEDDLPVGWKLQALSVLVVVLPVPADRLYEGPSGHHCGEDQGGSLIHCEVAGSNRGIGPGDL